MVGLRNGSAWFGEVLRWVYGAWEQLVSLLTSHGHGVSATTEVHHSEGMKRGCIVATLGRVSYMLLLEAIQQHSDLVHAFNHVFLHDGGIVHLLVR